MAHFAKVENGFVTDLIVVDNDDCGGGEFPSSEIVGREFIRALSENEPRLVGDWYQTSYNTRNGVHYGSDGWTPTGRETFRMNFGEIGYRYDSSLDAFLPPEPEPEA